MDDKFLKIINGMQPLEGEDCNLTGGFASIVPNEHIITGSGPVQAMGVTNSAATCTNTKNCEESLNTLNCFNNKKACGQTSNSKICETGTNLS